MAIDDKIYGFLCVVFAVITVTGNLICKKFVYLDIFSLHTFEVSAGALLYPLTFVITDIIAEFFGRDKSSFCVRIAIYVNIFIALIIVIIAKLPATSWSTISDEQFTYTFGHYKTGVLSSIIASYTSQFIDIRLYLLIKKITNGKMIWLRNIGSTSISLLVDTIIIITILTYFGSFPKEAMFILIVNSYLYKLFFTICNAPIFYIYYYIIKFLRSGNQSPKLAGAE
jgi:uncharacterized integral membrane protein (TIGR00697 family)